MEKRKLIIGEYDTAENWTLSACKITKGAQVQNFVSVPGRFAPLNLSTYLTDGEPYYESATLEATLESSEGTREQRGVLINQLINYADGRSLHIVHPDHPGSYLVGAVQIKPNYNDLAHCSVAISAICEPWLYNDEETVISIEVPGTETAINLLEYPYQETSKSAYGVTYTDNGDGTITINGRNNGRGNAVFYLKYEPVLDPGTYTLSAGVPGVDTMVNILLSSGSQSWKRGTFTLAEGDTVRSFYLQVGDDSIQHFTNALARPMLVPGNSAQDYEPYFTEGEVLARLTNAGRLAVVPIVNILGEVTLSHGGTTQTFSSGAYTLPWLNLTPSENLSGPVTHYVRCSGDGTATFIYREAVLAG